MSPSLRLHISGQPSREIQLLGQVYRLGRDPDAEIVIQHPAISKRHACWSAAMASGSSRIKAPPTD